MADPNKILTERLREQQEQAEQYREFEKETLVSQRDASQLRLRGAEQGRVGNSGVLKNTTIGKVGSVLTGKKNDKDQSQDQDAASKVESKIKGQIAQQAVVSATGSALSTFVSGVVTTASYLVGAATILGGILVAVFGWVVAILVFVISLGAIFTWMYCLIFGC